MTDRRPHWDDDLIDAVIAAQADAYDYEYRAMAAIAAVEDRLKDYWAKGETDA